ncbi:NAD-binding protein [Haloechinothrix salitolerans]|uniref:NAD-binding protein n=1 Tax=Haloechinothrix salitolerans TaxID=926830 RepID=UPI0035EB7135
MDFDPQRVSANTRDSVTAMFGSAEDVHLLDNLPLASARYVISTIPALDTNRRSCTACGITTIAARSH